MANFFHETTKIGTITSIDVSNRGTHTYIGENSVIDDFVKIKHVGGLGDIKIGAHVYINSGCVLYSGNGIIIGDNVLIGPNCNLVPVNHNWTNKNVLIRLQGFQESKGGIVIEDDVWIGAGVTILDGSYVSKGSIIAANSLVNSFIEPYAVYAGTPCKIIKKRGE